MPLGWIVFEAVAVPEPEIYLSFSNAQSMMDVSRDVVGLADQLDGGFPVQHEHGLRRSRC